VDQPLDHDLGRGLAINDVALAGGDGAPVSGWTTLALAATAPSEFLLFDLA
jgi:hypothetical protein